MTTPTVMGSAVGACQQDDSADAGDPDTAEQLVIVAIRPGDHDWVASRHIEDLRHGLFPRLGRRFVVAWHRAHVASPHGVSYVALREGRPVGFLLGCVDRRAHVAWILDHRRAELLRVGLRALVVRPRLLSSFLRTRAARYLRRLLTRTPAAARTDQVPAAPIDHRPTRGTVAVLDAIVVAGAARGQGIGSQLVRRFLQDAAQSGAESAELVTMAGPDGAAGFYERRGWQQIGSHRDRDGLEVLTFRVEAGPDA